MSAAEVRRRHYGIAEIADALGLNRQLVTVWRRRRSWGMPEPDDELASGPLWLGSTVEPWIDAVRARLGEQSTAAEQLGPELIRRAGRRLLRLAALLLEDSPRLQLVARAYTELGEAAEAVRGCAPGADRDLMLTALDRVLPHPVRDPGEDAPAPGEDAPAGGSAASCLAALTEVMPLLRHSG